MVCAEICACVASHVRGCAGSQEGLQFKERVVRRSVGARKLKLICELQSAGNDHLATIEDLLSYTFIVSSYGVASEIPHLGNLVSVLVTHVEASGNFFVQINSEAGKLDVLMEQIEHHVLTGRARSTNTLRNHGRIYLFSPISGRQSMVPLSSVRCEPCRTAV